MKILIIGHGRHGKDTVAEGLVKSLPQLSFASSSLFVAEKVIMPASGDTLPLYRDVEQCYNDRHSKDNREEWKRLIAEYCDPPERLAQELTKEHDIYVGMRTRREFEASKNLFDLIVWVDRSVRLPDDPTCELNMHDAHTCVDNNFSMAALRMEIRGLEHHIRHMLRQEARNG